MRRRTLWIDEWGQIWQKIDSYRVWNEVNGFGFWDHGKGLVKWYETTKQR